MIQLMTPVTAWEALDLARVLSPLWVQQQGCVIRADVFEQGNFAQWWSATGGDRNRVEAGVNHLHLWDLLPSTDESDFAELWELGEAMVRGWTASLARDFPDRRFSVTLTDDYGPTVSVISLDAAAASDPLDMVGFRALVLLSVQQALLAMVELDLLRVEVRLRGRSVDGRFFYQRSSDDAAREDVSEIETLVIADLPDGARTTFEALFDQVPAATMGAEWICCFLRRD